MEVSKTLKKQIFIEILALLFFIGVILYAVFAINKSNKNKVSNFQGMVAILDDSKYKELSISSDGVGLEGDGVTYAITNNNNNRVTYKVVITPNITDSKTLDQIRVSVDDLYTLNLTELEQYEGGYIITTHKLDAGYTKIHLIKYWYKLDSDENKIVKNIKFDYSLIKEES